MKTPHAREPATACRLATEVEAKRGEVIISGNSGVPCGRLRLRLGAVDGSGGNPPEVISVETGADGIFREEYANGLFLEWAAVPMGTGLKVSWKLENRSAEEIRLHEVVLEGTLKAGEAVEESSLRFLDGMAGGGFTKVEAVKSHHSENNLLATFRTLSGKRKSLVLGGLSYEEFAKYAEASVDLSTGDVSFSLAARDAVGRLLDPGEAYAPHDGFYCDMLEADPFDSLERYGLAVREEMQAAPNPYDFLTVCGWYASMSAYGAGNYINNSSGLVAEAEAAESSTLSNYTRVACRLVPDTYDKASLGDVDVSNFHPSILSPDRNTEQGWWDDEHFRKFGHLTEPYETLAKWGTAVGRHGAIPILYVQSGLVSYDYAKAHPGHMLRNDISRLDEVFDKLPHVTYDYTDPEFQDHLRRTWAAMKLAGIKGVMFDYPHMVWHEKGGFEDRKATAASAYRTMFRLAKEGLGSESWIQENLVKKRWPHYVEMSIGLVDSQRICADNDRVRPDFYRRGALRWYKNRVLYNYDMDAKHIHRINPGTRDGFRQMVTMLYATTSRLILAHTTKWLKQEHIHDISRCYPVHTVPRSARPLDAFVNDGCPSIYDFKVDDDWHQLTLYNEDTDNSKELVVSLSGDTAEGGLGLYPESNYYIYDFWNDAFGGTKSGSDTLLQRLRPGEARMISIRRVLDHPQVVSTNRHLLQGFVDLQDVSWDPESKILSGKSDLVKGDSYELVIAANGHRLLSCTSESGDSWIDGSPWDDSIVRVRLLSQESGLTGWSLAFEPKEPGAPCRGDLAEANCIRLGEGENRVMDWMSVGFRFPGNRPVNSLDQRYSLEREHTPLGERLIFSDTSDERIDLVLNLRPCGSLSWRMSLEIHNRGEQPFKVESVEVCSGRVPFQGDPGKVIPNSYWVGYRTEDEKIYTPQTGRTYTNSFYTLTVERPSIATGFTTGNHNVNRFDLFCGEDSLGLRAYGEADGVTLPPGGTRNSDELFISFRESSLAQMERFGDLAAECNRTSPLKKNTAVWCSWYSGWMGRQKQQYLRTWKGGLEAGVESQIQPIARLLGSRARCAMRIVDDSREMSLGDWDDVTEKIPHGYQRMAALMDAEDVVPGVWITPFYVGTASRLFKEHPELLASDDKGNPFLPGYAGIPCGILDSTVPGSQEHFRRMGAMWRERGFDYIMTDFLRSQYFAPGFADKTQTHTEAHRTALEALREGLGEDAFWLACTALPGPCMGLADAFRVSGDSFGGVTKKGGPFAYTQSAYRWFYNGRVWHNDPDSVITRGWWDFKRKEYVRESHPVSYLQAYFSWIAVAGLVFTFGDTFDDELPEENLEIYRKILPPMSIIGRPLDIWENDPHYLWGVRPSTNPEHPVLLGAFTLFEADSLRLRVNLPEAVRRIGGFDTNEPGEPEWIAWDFWNEKEVPVNGDTVEFDLEPSACRLLSLVPKRNRPGLVSSSGHFSQGALEIPGLQWSAGSEGGGCLAGEVAPNGGDATTLYFHIPDGSGGVELTLDGQVAELLSLGGGIHKVQVNPSSQPVPLKLSVSKLPSPETVSSRAPTGVPLVEVIR